MIFVATNTGADARSHAPIYTGSYSGGIWERGKSRAKRAAAQRSRTRRAPQVGGDYLNQVSEGGNSRWGSHKMPLSVYVSPSPYGRIGIRRMATRLGRTHKLDPSIFAIICRHRRELVS